MCNCVETINEKMAEANLNTRIKVPLLFDKDMNVRGRKLEVVTEKVNTNIRKKPVPVFTNYCPFCGEKHEADAI